MPNAEAIATKMKTVYACLRSPRLHFVLDFIYGVGDYEVTTDRSAYLRAADPALCYADEDLGAGVHCAPYSDFLRQEKFTPLQPQVSTRTDGLPILFPIEKTALGFDALSAIFYLLSRYEEYGSTDIDEHGRFRAEASILYQMNCLLRPLCDEYAAMLNPVGRKGEIILTHDIDNPYRYRNRGLLRTLWALLRHPLHTMCLRPDPYFQTIESLVKKDRECGYSSILFLHTGQRSAYDRGRGMRSREYRRLIKQLYTQGTTIGLHPSYCAQNTDQIARELHEMKHLYTDIFVGTCKKSASPQTQISISRQHYLRFIIPNTPRALIAAGITDDYSLGYSTHSGFRAGTARPFPYYDIDNNTATTLTLHPLLCMDITLLRAGFSPEKAHAEMFRLARHAAEQGGEAILLIHNDSTLAQVYLRHSPA